MYLTFLIIQQGLGIFIRLDGKVRSENRNKYSYVEGLTDTLINTTQIKKSQEI